MHWGVTVRALDMRWYIANSMLRTSLAIIIIMIIISNKREWNNWFIKTTQKNHVLDLADFALQEPPEDNLMVLFLRHGIINNYSTCVRWI